MSRDNDETHRLQQEMFDRVVAHMRAQGQQSVFRFEGSASTMCAYRGPDGLKCAIGCLIPDDVYTPRMEGQAVGAIVARFPDVRRALRPGAVGLNFLTELQEAHDNVQFLALDFETCARRLAGNWGLTYTPAGAP